MENNTNTVLESFHKLDAITTAQIEKIEKQSNEIRWLQKNLLQEKQERSLESVKFRTLCHENTVHLKLIKELNNENVKLNDTIDKQNKLLATQAEEIFRLSDDNRHYVTKLHEYETILAEKQELLQYMQEENGRLSEIGNMSEMAEQEARVRKEREERSFCDKIRVWWQELFTFHKNKANATRRSDIIDLDKDYDASKMA